MNTNQKNRNDRSRKDHAEVNYEVISTRVGAARSHNPEIDGRLYLLGVQVRARHSRRKTFVEYVLGWFVVDKAKLESLPEGEVPEHEFVPRFSIGDEDVVEVLRLLHETAAEVKVYFTNLEKKAAGNLTHRLTMESGNG